MNKLSINRWLAHVFCWMSVVVLSANCEPQLNPNISVTSVSINPSNVYICVGESTQLAATVMPEDATDKTVTWSSSDPTIASVNEGKVTALKEGETLIKAAVGGKTAECAVQVAAKTIPVESVTLDKTTLSLTEGDSATLTATVMPEDATDKTVTWSSSDPTIASVNEGKVTALKEGETIITASAGNAGAWCLVKVLPSSIDGGHEGTGEKIWK